ncbi:BZ3501_MvSof-1269-A2-R1_Chr1-3g01132 [Microbotryum saponariae]|nr:BZ3501_MvSof-1269-A2-R1_Chr1-3g01132 [Microbotryum saponariae]
MLVGWGAFTVARTGPSQPVAQDTHEWDRAVTVAPILSVLPLAAITWVAPRRRDHRPRATQPAA